MSGPYPCTTCGHDSLLLGVGRIGIPVRSDHWVLFPVFAVLLHRFGGRITLTAKELALAERISIQVTGEDPATYQVILDGKAVDTP